MMLFFETARNDMSKIERPTSLCFCGIEVKLVKKNKSILICGQLTIVRVTRSLLTLK